LLQGLAAVQLHRLKRREVITLVGGAAICPLCASAQQPRMPVIGFKLGWSEPRNAPEPIGTNHGQRLLFAFFTFACFGHAISLATAQN
jgi:hypothetical protein